VHENAREEAKITLEQNIDNVNVVVEENKRALRNLNNELKNDVSVAKFKPEASIASIASVRSSSNSLSRKIKIHSKDLDFLRKNRSYIK